VPKDHQQIFANHYADDAGDGRLARLVDLATAEEEHGKARRQFFAALQGEPEWRLALLALDIPVAEGRRDETGLYSNLRLSDGIDREAGLRIVERIKAEHGIKIETAALGLQMWPTAETA
jgi:hypothetical protein